MLGFGSRVLHVAGRAMAESTNHEYGEREATRTCLACPTALVGGLFENGCNNLRFYDLSTVNLFQDVNSFQTLFWDPNRLILEVFIKSTHFQRLQP